MKAMPIRIRVAQLHTTNSKLMMHLPNFTEIKKIEFFYLMHVLFDFILLIFVSAKFVYGIRSIDLYRQFIFFSLKGYCDALSFVFYMVEFVSYSP
jgi:hypothetical protein